MKKTYYKTYFGTNEAVEAGIRKFDQVLRRMYNVYGGHREYSYKNADGEYQVTMSYTANWNGLSNMFPEFRIQSINKRFAIEAARLPKEIEENFYCDVLKDENGDPVDRW